MNTILKFDPRPSGREQRPIRPEETAKIILFPGVRYERSTDEPADSAGKPGRKEG